MMHHLVLLKVRSDVPASEVERVFGLLDGLRNDIDGLESFRGGPYSSPEGLARGFTHAFVMEFRDAASRDAYLPHPAHEAVKSEVLGILDGGIDAVLAFDFGA